jgi:hypothetical protein
MHETNHKRWSCWYWYQKHAFNSYWKKVVSACSKELCLLVSRRCLQMVVGLHARTLLACVES